MGMGIKIAALSAVCLLCSCATAYQPDGFTGGYSDQRMSSNTAQVTFRGNRFNTPERLHSFLLRRCAEVTTQNGYEYFALLNEAPSDGAKVDQYSASATIKMFKAGDKAEPDVHAYDAASVIRSIPVEEGETAESLPPPPTTVSVAGRMPVLNPNAPTNEPLPPFEQF